MVEDPDIVSEEDNMAGSDSDAPVPLRRANRRAPQDLSDLDTDSDDDDLGGGRGPADLANILYAAFPQRGIWPLNRQRPPLDDNDALVDHLTRTSVLWVSQIGQAMKVCSRDQFVPGGVRDHPDVFADAPVHVIGFGFNISAPHMHATCLQALDLKPGHRVLDVGSGSGLLSAYAAVLVGKNGSVVGVDCSKSATRLAKSNIKRQLRSNKAFADKAAPCSFHMHNVFMPSTSHQGQYDRIVVGASCPPEKVEWLLSLLRPEGGILVTPVKPSDLRRITKHSNGTSTNRVISQVRFSDLEIPREVSILKAILEEDRLAAIKPPVLESTFAMDIACISGSLNSPMASSSLGSEQSTIGRGAFSETPPSSSWPRRVTKIFTACSSSLSDRSSTDGAGMDTDDTTKVPVSLDVTELGPFDCFFRGLDWSLPAHKCVLRARSELFRAQSASGMRDAEATERHVPEHFTKEAIDTFLRFCYTDKLEGCNEAEATANCLAVAEYYQAPHLVQLCETSLAAELEEADDSAIKLVAQLLALADETGLSYLQARALDFIVLHHSAVAATPAYAALTKRQTDLVAAHACTRMQRFREVLDAMEATTPSTTHDSYA